MKVSTVRNGQRGMIGSNNRLTHDSRKHGGVARRPTAVDREPTACTYLSHKAPTHHRDHGECPIALLACPEHRED